MPKPGMPGRNSQGPMVEETSLVFSATAAVAPPPERIAWSTTVSPSCRIVPVPSTSKPMLTLGYSPGRIGLGKTQVTVEASSVQGTPPPIPNPSAAFSVRPAGSVSVIVTGPSVGAVPTLVASRKYWGSRPKPYELYMAPGSRLVGTELISKRQAGAASALA